MATPPVVVSNRGPVSFRTGEDGSLVPRRGAGGLVSALGPAVQGTGATWVAAAIGEADRQAAAGGVVDAEGYRLRLLEVDEAAYQAFYDVVSNRSLWFAYHGLDDRPLAPALGPSWHDAWDAYVEVNRAFAAAVAEEAPEGGTVLVQDLHLSLVGAELARSRPDLATAHFAHTPFCWPDGLEVIPPAARRQLLEGLAGHGAVGFHTGRWARAFLACCAEEGVAPPPVYVAPAAADPDDLARAASGEACARHLAAIEELAGDRQLVVRVDRMELSKNVVRGFQAFGLLLERHPELAERTLFFACCYPTREGVAEYATYKRRVLEEVDAIRERWGDVVHLVTDDDFPRSVAALRRADVCLVNPIRDGLNMVAKEVLLVNERDAALCLSPGAGAWEELGTEGAIATPPYDLAGTADALHAALTMPADERRSRAARLHARAAARRPVDWLDDQLRAAAPPRAGSPR